MNIRARLRREDGAAAVEFALIAGVLAMLIFGMLQFGVAFFQLQNLRAADPRGRPDRRGRRHGRADQAGTSSEHRSARSPANSGAVNV